MATHLNFPTVVVVRFERNTLYIFRLIHGQYWFAHDVTAAMLVVKNKSISLLWELNSIFM